MTRGRRVLSLLWMCTVWSVSEQSQLKQGFLEGLTLCLTHKSFGMYTRHWWLGGESTADEVTLALALRNLEGEAFQLTCLGHMQAKLAHPASVVQTPHPKGKGSEEPDTEDIIWSACPTQGPFALARMWLQVRVMPTNATTAMLWLRHR